MGTHCVYIVHDTPLIKINRIHRWQVDLGSGEMSGCRRSSSGVVQSSGNSSPLSYLPTAPTHVVDPKSGCLMFFTPDPKVNSFFVYTPVTPEPALPLASRTQPGTSWECRFRCLTGDIGEVMNQVPDEKHLMYCNYYIIDWAEFRSLVRKCIHVQSFSSTNVLSPLFDHYHPTE